MTNKRQEYVYLMRTPTGFYKVGRSINPIARALGLRSTLLHTIPCDYAHEAERKLHQMLSDWRAPDVEDDLPDGHTEVFMLPGDFADIIGTIVEYHQGAFYPTPRFPTVDMVEYNLGWPN